MAKKVNIVGTQPKHIRVVDRPSRRIDPAELAASLGAEPCGERLGPNPDPISLAELGTELLRRLRSSGGRPALVDAMEFCRVPLSGDDVKALETITNQIERKTGTKPSPGQVASIIVRAYLSNGSAKSQDPAVNATMENTVNDHLAAIAAWAPRLIEIATEASALQKRANAIEAAAKEIKEDIDRRVGEILALRRVDAE